MKNFKKIGLVLLTLTMVFALAACGGGDSEDSGDGGSAAGGMTASELRAVYDTHTGADAEVSFLDMDYDQVVEAFGGQEPMKDEEDSDDTTMSYYYQASDTDGNVSFLFEDVDGVLDCISSSSTIPAE